IPGNHDHHFWQDLAEQVAVNGQIKKGGLPPGCNEFPFHFVDRRFSSGDQDLAPEILLSYFWPEDSNPPEFVVKYPHHLLQVEQGGELKNYLVTHGHFLEELFHPVNYIIEPAHLEELESFNCFWLESFDYHLGQSGRLAGRVRDFVSAYEKGGSIARKKVNQVLSSAADNIARQLKLNWWKKLLMKIVLKIALKTLPFKKHGQLFRVAINPKLMENIRFYIEKYVLPRYREGRAAELALPVDADIPVPFTFVFGHTHRPVWDKDQPATFIYINQDRYYLLNSGGWLRTDGTGKADGENAGMLKIDENGASWLSLKGTLQ
ncbi:MAG: hypothetical protein WAN36_12905, partial [Calditrichia bacterium]